MNDLVRFEQHLPQSASSIRAQVNLVQEVMKAVMKEGTHYGTIPGTPKPSLWKPGAEVLASTFHIAPSYRVEDLSGPDFVRYRVTCVGTHQASSVVMGEGMGECSSLEEKYKWRKASSAREFDNTAEDRRRFKYGYDRAKRQEYEIKQVRAESADQANTILKMACKRAQVAMTLNVVAASDIFTQDIEDLPPELRPEDDDQTPQQPIQQPQSKSAPAATGTPSPATTTGGGADAVGDKPAGNGKPLSPGQAGMLRAKLRAAALSELDFEVAYPKWALEPKGGRDLLPMSEVNAVIKWLEEKAKANG